MATSTTEAEYIALAEAAKEAIWLKRFLEELLSTTLVALEIHEDNHSAGILAEHPSYHPRTKHIDVRWHYIRERVGAGELKIRLTPSALMVADFLTKGVPVAKHEWCAKEMGLTDV